MTQPQHRELITRLEADRTRLLAGLDDTTPEKIVDTVTGIAGGYLHATVLAVRIFEGVEAAARYARDHADGVHLIVHDEPQNTSEHP